MLKRQIINFLKKNIYYISPEKEMVYSKDARKYKQNRIQVALFFLFGGVLGIIFYLLNPGNLPALSASIVMIFIGLSYLLYFFLRNLE